MVGRETVVIQCHALVTQRHILRDQTACTLLAQWFGGDNVAAGRNHRAAQLGVELAHIGIAAQHQLFGAHPAGGRVDRHGVTILDAADWRMLEQPSAELTGCGCFTQHQIKRVQVAGAHVGHAADILIGADHAVQLLTLDQRHFMAITE